MQEATSVDTARCLGIGVHRAGLMGGCTRSGGAHKRNAQSKDHEGLVAIVTRYDARGGSERRPGREGGQPVVPGVYPYVGVRQ